MKGSQPKRRKPLRRTALKAGTKSVAHSSPFASPVPTRPRVRFKARTPARTQRCFRCNRQAHTWHHWIEQQHLRTYSARVSRRLGLCEDDERRLLRDLLRDPRNLSAACATCHLDAEHGNKPFRADEIPASAYVFARELGPWAVGRLDRIGTR